MSIKTTILSLTASIALMGCSQRSYVMSFQSTADAQGYAVPRSLNPESTTPSKVSSPEKPTAARKVERPTVAGNSALQATNDSNIEGEEPNYTDNQAVGTSPFAGNESEHVRFTNYNPFTSGELRVDLNAAASEFTYPIDGKFSSGYGRRGRGTHTGVDLVAPALTPVHAVFDGVVRLSKPYSGYGNVIVVRHQNGLETVYAHNTTNLVRPGQSVKSGQVIAKCGRTGRATTNHLHFEVRIQGQTINPKLLIDVDAKKLQSGVLVVSKGSSGGITAKLSDGGSNAEPYDELEQPTKVLAQAAPKVEQEQPREQPKEQPRESKSEKSEQVGKSVSASPASPSQSKGIRVGDKVYDAPAAPAVKAQYHAIVSGDTLSTIARKYGTTTSELCRLNSITRNSVIKTGKKLRVK